MICIDFIEEAIKDTDDPELLRKAVSCLVDYIRGIDSVQITRVEVEKMLESYLKREE